jgi:hypothetical protein
MVMNDLSELILDTAKSAMQVSQASFDAGYLQGERAGYERGWKAACKAALQLANKALAQDVSNGT